MQIHAREMFSFLNLASGSKPVVALNLSGDSAEQRLQRSEVRWLYVDYGGVYRFWRCRKLRLLRYERALTNVDAARLRTRRQQRTFRPVDAVLLIHKHAT